MKNNQPEAKGKTLRQVMKQEAKAPLWVVLCIFGGMAALAEAAAFRSVALTGHVEPWVPLAVTGAALLALPLAIRILREAWKKARQMQKPDDSAVSPVVGVILMVAITVVLAAVVFIFVSHLSQNTPEAPTSFAATFTAADSSSLTYRVVSVEPNQVQWDSCQVRDDGGSIHPFTVNGAAIVAGSKAQAGDVFKVSSLVSKNTYNLALTCVGNIVTTVQGTTL